jgi:hypothetical protein
MPVSMIFFLATTELSLVEVGFALSLASMLSLPDWVSAAVFVINTLLIGLVRASSCSG